MNATQTIIYHSVTQKLRRYNSDDFKDISKILHRLFSETRVHSHTYEGQVFVWANGVACQSILLLALVKISGNKCLASPHPLVFISSDRYYLIVRMYDDLILIINMSLMVGKRGLHSSWAQTVSSMHVFMIDLLSKYINAQNIQHSSPFISPFLFFYQFIFISVTF